MLKGFNHVSVPVTDREKTAFSSPLGKYHFKRIPFGLNNAPMSNRIVAYIDDITVYPKTWEQHLSYLQEVFAIIKAVGLTLRQDKCLIGSDKCEFLGHFAGR